MNKSSLMFILLVLILALGIYAFIFLGNSKKDNKVVTLPNECVEIKHFPAKSKEISTVKKGKSGYFPDKVFAKAHWEEADAFMNDWYGKYLKVSKEKSLLDISDKNLEVYRFTWLRSFERPIIVRLEKQTDQIKIFSRELNIDEKGEPDILIKDEKNSINKTDWCKFIKLLNDTDYWQMPSMEGKPSGTDGSQWIVEGVKENRYHIVDRWTPREGKYRELGLFMLKLSGFDLDKNKDVLY